MFDPFVSKLTGFLDWEKKKDFSHSGGARCSCYSTTTISISMIKMTLGPQHCGSCLQQEHSKVPCLFARISGAIWRVLCVFGRRISGVPHAEALSWAERSQWGHVLQLSVRRRRILRSKRSECQSLGKYGGTRGARLQKHSAKASACRGRAAPVKGGALTPSRVLSYSKDKVFLLQNLQPCTGIRKKPYQDFK